MPRTAQLPCPGCGQGARRWLRWSWSHTGYPARSGHRSTGRRRWRGEQGGAGVWTAGLDRARTGLQGAGGEGAADRRHRWGARQAGPRPAHLSLPFWMEAWPRLALSRSGEFLLRFVLVERTLFCGEEGEELYHRKPKWSQIQLPSPLSTMSNGGGRGGEKGCCFDSGGQGFLR